MVFQEYLLFPHLTVLANVAFGLQSRGRSKVDSERLAMEWLNRMELGDKAQSKPRRLSGGQAQRVALARALATEPRLLLLDEPMAALDVSTRGSIRHQLRRHLGEFGGSCVLVTHDPLDAAAVADRLVIVEAGRMVQQGTLAAVTTRPRTAATSPNSWASTCSGDGRAVRAWCSLTARPSRWPVRWTVRCWPWSPPVTSPSTWCPQRGAPATRGQHGWPRYTSWATGSRVLLDAPIRMAAEITAVSLAELGLTDGSRVWASVKATQIDVYGDDRA